MIPSRPSNAHEAAQLGEEGAPPETVQAFVEALVTRETAGLLAYFARRVSPVDDAADLLAETLLVLWRRGETVPRDPEAARMWAYGVARKVLSTHHRSRSRRTALADRLRSELSARGAFATDDVGSAADRVHRALSELSVVDREIVRLVHWDRFSLVEVAGLLGKKESTVRSRYHRARGRMKQHLTVREA